MLFIVLPPDESSMAKITNVSRRIAKLVCIVGMPLEVSGRNKFLVAQKTISGVIWIAHRFFHVAALTVFN
jgi:hypothetical protein